MIKLVVSDIDGTLVDQSEELREPAFRMVSWLRERGVLFTLATGRVQGMAEKYAEKLGIAVPYVASNGASLILNGKAIRRDTVPLRPLEEMILRADALGLSVIYSPDGYERVQRVTPFILGQQRAFSRYFHVEPLTRQDFATGQIEKLCLMDDDRTGRIEEIARMAAVLPGAYGFTRYGDRAVEIVRGGATKASGVRELARLLGVSLSEVLTAGDDENDLEMLSEAGVGVTVQNALPKVKARASYVASQPTAAGVFEAVRRYTNENSEKEA